jgi:hypothetical protein
MAGKRWHKIPSPGFPFVYNLIIVSFLSWFRGFHSMGFSREAL